MYNISKRAVATFSKQEIYDIIADVGKYSQFIPSCSNSEVKVIDAESVVGTLYVSRIGISYSFSTVNRHLKDKIVMQLVKPNDILSELDGVWSFNSISENETEILFELKYDVSGLYKFVVPAVIDGLIDNMMAAFNKRAHELKYDYKN